ncbi:uncharacterized protein LOC120348491 [Styela clava]
MQVTKSDIDQLVLGYVAEERYIGTRDRLFQDSPNLPEKVPILPLFGDIPSEHRLHTILREYVELKTKHMASACPLCNNCNSVSELFRVLHLIVDKIENFNLSVSPPQLQEISTPTPEVHRLSPSSISQERREKSSKKSPNAIKRTVPGLDKEMGLPFHRKQFNPETQIYETVQDHTSSNLGKSSFGSSRRKKPTMPKRLLPTQQHQQLNSYDDELSKLLQTTDTTNALALVGVKILSNIKKCGVVKGSSTENAPNEVTSTVSPVKNPSLPSLDIDDLISDETRGGLVEMTIDSLLNHNPDDCAQEETSLKNFDEDLSELRKLLEFEDSNMSNLNLPDVIQAKQDERYLMNIIKDDDDDLPSNPTIELQSELPIDNSLKVSGQSPDEKQAIGGLLAIQCCHENGRDKDSAVEHTLNGNDVNYNKETEDLFELPSVIEHDAQSPILPTIINVISHSENPPNESVFNLPNGTKTLETTTKTLSNEPSGTLQQTDIATDVTVNINQPQTQDDNFNKPCSTMPPKKRFLAQGSITPEKSTPINKAESVTMPNPLNSLNQNGNCLNFTISNSGQKTLIKLRSPDMVSAAVALADLESTVNTPNPDSTALNHDEKQRNESCLSPSQLRRSKRQKKSNFCLKDVVGKRRPSSRGRKSDEGDVKENAKKNLMKKGCQKKSNLSTSNIDRNLEETPNKLCVMNPGKGAVTLRLNDRGRMPLLVKGILAQPKGGKITQDIIGRLVEQLQDKGGGNESPSKVQQAHLPVVDKNNIIVDSNKEVANIITDPTHETQISSLPQLPPSSSIVSDMLAPLSSCSSLVSQIPEPDCLNSLQISEHVTQMSNTISSMPQNLLCMSHTLPMPSNLVIDTTVNMLNTGDEVSSVNDFSTISPSAGIFSVIGDKQNSSNGHSNVKIDDKLIAAKSNLTKLFANSEPVVQCVDSDVANSQKTLTASEKTFADLSTVSHSCASMVVSNSLAQTGTPPIEVFVPLVPGSRSLSQLESQVRARKKGKGQAKEKVSTKVYGSKKPNSIYMCNNKKEMVRIEPKRSSKVAAVRRSIVPVGRTDQSTPVRSVTTSIEKTHSKTSFSEDVTKVREVRSVENLNKDQSRKLQGKNKFDIEELLQEASTNVQTEHNLEKIPITSSANTSDEISKEVYSESSCSLHIVENMENCGPLEKLMQSAELEYRASESLQPELKLVNLNLSSDEVVSNISVISDIASKISITPSSKHDGLEINEKYKSNHISTLFYSPKKKRLKRKKKSMSSDKCKKPKIKSSPLMKLSYDEIQAKLDTVHGKKEEKGINANVQSVEMSEIQIRSDAIPGERETNKTDSLFNFEAGMKKNHKIHQHRNSSPNKRSNNKFDELQNQHEKILHKHDESRTLLLEMEPLDFSLSSWANSDTMQKFLTDSPFKMPDNFKRNWPDDKTKDTSFSTSACSNTTIVTDHTVLTANTIDPTSRDDERTNTSSKSFRQNSASGRGIQSESDKESQIFSKDIEDGCNTNTPVTGCTQKIVRNSITCDKELTNTSTLSNSSGHKIKNESIRVNGNKIISGCNDLKSDTFVPSNNNEVGISKKRRSDEKHGKQRRKSRTFKNLTYEEIQAKLDALYGTKNDENKTPECHKTVNFLTNNEVKTKLNKIDFKKNLKKKKILADTEVESIKNKNRIQNPSHESKNNGGVANIKNTSEIITQAALKCAIVETTDGVVNDIHRPKNQTKSLALSNSMNNKPNSRDPKAIDMDTLNLKTTELKGVEKACDNQHSQEPSNAGTILKYSPTTSVYEMEPMDLSCSSWANLKSPEKMVNEHLVKIENKQTRVVSDSGEIPELHKQKVNHTRHTLLSRENNENTSSMQKFNRKKKKQKLGKESQKISKRSKKPRKMNLKDINISDFLDSLDYGE